MSGQVAIDFRHQGECHIHHREIIPNFKNQSALEMYYHFQGTFLL